jgi:hypothetical protein
MTLGVSFQHADKPDAAAIEQSRRLAESFKELMSAYARDLKVNPRSPADQAQVSEMHAVADDPRCLPVFVRWIQNSFLPAFPNGRWAATACDLSGRTVVHARWLRLGCESADFDEYFRYPIKCSQCQYFDFDQVPSPLVVNPAIVRGGNAKIEIFEIANAILIVNQRVRDIFSQLVPEEIGRGAVSVSGRPDLDGRFFWVRPRTHALQLADEISKDPCPECGVPRIVSKGSNDVASFGESNANIARIGYYPCPGRGLTGPRDWPIAVSGGLFAALYNLNVKGLYWPSFGSQILFSAKDGEYPLELQRRFEGVVAAKSDKAIKKKAS